MGYLVKPLREGELRPAIELAMARFQAFATLQKKNEDLKKDLGARKRHSHGEPATDRSCIAAFALLQRKSMDTRKPMVEIAQTIVLAEEMTKRS
jgi:AmiR/NasT family two-component response regulator